MSSTNNMAQTHSKLKEDIKNLKQKCSETYNNITNNMALEMQSITLDNLEEKALCYVDGLRADLEASDPKINTDRNLVTSQFLAQLNENIGQVEELMTIKRSLILDLDAEINGIKTQIAIAKEAKSNTKPDKVEIKREHLQKAKDKFKIVKGSLHGLINSLFPEIAEDLFELLAHLMQERMSQESSGYIEITSQKYHLIRVLLDLGVVIRHPYDKRHVKLAY